MPENEFLNCFSPVKNLNIVYNLSNVGSQCSDSVDGSNEGASQNAYLHGVKGSLLMWGIMAHSFIYAGQYFAQGYGSVKEQEIPWYLLSFVKRFLPFAQNLYLLGGFVSMWSW